MTITLGAKQRSVVALCIVVILPTFWLAGTGCVLHPMGSTPWRTTRLMARSRVADSRFLRWHGASAQPTDTNTSTETTSSTETNTTTTAANATATRTMTETTTSTTLTDPLETNATTAMASGPTGPDATTPTATTSLSANATITESSSGGSIVDATPTGSASSPGSPQATGPPSPPSPPRTTTTAGPDAPVPPPSPRNATTRLATQSTTPAQGGPATSGPGNATTATPVNPLEQLNGDGFDDTWRDAVDDKRLIVAARWLAVWLDTPFEAGRHVARLDKIRDYEVAHRGPRP